MTIIEKRDSLLGFVNSRRLRDSKAWLLEIEFNTAFDPILFAIIPRLFSIQKCNNFKLILENKI